MVNYIYHCGCSVCSVISVLTHELQVFLAIKLTNEGMHGTPAINFGAIRNKLSCLNLGFLPLIFQEKKVQIGAIVCILYA